jgi:hypothetical protein
MQIGRDMFPRWSSLVGSCQYFRRIVHQHNPKVA